MIIRTSGNEGKIHITLKKKAIEMLNNREDIVNIKTEHGVKSRRGKYYSRVDVTEIKNNGAEVYVEVKSDNTISSAIVQLMEVDRGRSQDEFIVICNFDRLNFFKNVWRNKIYKAQDFINKAQIYTYDSEYNLKHRDIKYKNRKELWVDGIRVI